MHRTVNSSRGQESAAARSRSTELGELRQLALPTVELAAPREFPLPAIDLAKKGHFADSPSPSCNAGKTVERGRGARESGNSSANAGDSNQIRLSRKMMGGAANPAAIEAIRMAPNRAATLARKRSHCHHDIQKSRNYFFRRGTPEDADGKRLFSILAACFSKNSKVCRSCPITAGLSLRIRERFK